MGRLTRAAAAFAAVLCASAAAAAPEQPARFAVVIGNADYAHVPDLANAARDARDMAALLRGFGFTVHDGYDLDRRGFEEIVRRVLLNLPEGAEVVFFYAGHGIQIGRRNYLLPTDVAFDSVYDLPVQSVTLDRVIEALAARGAAHLAIIDACRENPFPDLRLAADLDATLFEAESGFEVFRTPLNSLVAFSTSPGAIAFDGEDGGNSPYTGAVLETARTIPDESVLTLFSQVRERVWQATGGRQVPWESSTLVRPFRLAPAQAPAATGDDAAPEAASPARSPAPPPPAALSLTLPLDRTVPLGPALAQALDTPLGAVSVTAMPANGRIAFDADGAPVFHPTLAERRAAGLESFTLGDRFTLETGPAEARRPVTVTLTLEAGECDLAAGDALDLQGVGLYRLPNEIPVARALSACAEAVAAAPGSGHLRYQLGRAQQASGRLAEAFESFRIAAEAGHVRALNAQAYLLFTTRIDRAAVGIPLDEARAAGLLERGIAAGDPFAIHSRGLRLLRHGATPAERERGFDLLNRAAELGHTYSMNELGVYFLTRDGAHYQPERGMRYLAASSARDDIYGHHNLGFVALFGLDGKPPDHARARAWFERAAAGGHPFSPAALGRMIIRGQGGPVDRPAAVAWYDMGLARGDGWGGTNAAEIILDGGVSGLGPADAAVRAAKAAHLPAEDAAAAALALLDAMPAAALDRATQMILADIGEAVTVDGRIGPATRAALERVRARTGLPRAADTPRERLLLVARAYWAERPSRPDLF